VVYFGSEQRHQRLRRPIWKSCTRWARFVVVITKKSRTLRTRHCTRVILFGNRREHRNRRYLLFENKESVYAEAPDHDAPSYPYIFAAKPGKRTHTSTIIMFLELAARKKAIDQNHHDFENSQTSFSSVGFWNVRPASRGERHVLDIDIRFVNTVTARTVFFETRKRQTYPASSSILNFGGQGSKCCREEARSCARLRFYTCKPKPTAVVSA
jgi:hypothetical protein